MIKIKTSEKNINPFSGINFVLDHLEEKDIFPTIEQGLPQQGPQARFSWSDKLKSLWGIFLCGGECIDDIGSAGDKEKADHPFRKTLEDSPKVNVPSQDTLLRSLSMVAEEGATGYLKYPPLTRSCHHQGLDRALLRTSLKLGVIQRDGDHVLDYDQTFIETHKKDAQWGHTKEKGYYPGVMALDHNPISIENRSGNMAPASHQCGHIERTLDLLEEEGVRIGSFRADAASHQREVLELLEDRKVPYYIRAKKGGEITKAFDEIDHWEPIEMGDRYCEVAEVWLHTHGAEHARRHVITRTPDQSEQQDAFEGTWVHRAIVTTDHDSDMEEIVHLYNARGEDEQLYRELKEDMGWGALPYSDMESNTVFMLLTAFIKPIFESIKKWLAGTSVRIDPGARLKRLIFDLITVCGQWVRRGRQIFLKLFTKRSYERLYQPC